MRLRLLTFFPSDSGSCLFSRGSGSKEPKTSGSSLLRLPSPGSSINLDGAGVKVLLADQLLRVLLEHDHLLLLLGHQVLEGLVGLEVRLHLLNGSAAVRVGQRDLLGRDEDR